MLTKNEEKNLKRFMKHEMKKFICEWEKNKKVLLDVGYKKSDIGINYSEIYKRIYCWVLSPKEKIKKAFDNGEITTA